MIYITVKRSATNLYPHRLYYSVPLSSCVVERIITGRKVYTCSTRMHFILNILRLWMDASTHRNLQIWRANRSKEGMHFAYVACSKSVPPASSQINTGRLLINYESLTDGLGLFLTGPCNLSQSTLLLIYGLPFCLIFFYYSIVCLLLSVSVRFLRSSSSQHSLCPENLA